MRADLVQIIGNSRQDTTNSPSVLFNEAFFCSYSGFHRVPQKSTLGIVRTNVLQAECHPTNSIEA